MTKRDLCLLLVLIPWLAHGTLVWFSIPCGSPVLTSLCLGSLASLPLACFVIGLGLRRRELRRTELLGLALLLAPAIAAYYRFMGWFIGGVLFLTVLALCFVGGLIRGVACCRKDTADSTSVEVTLPQPILNEFSWRYVVAWIGLLLGVSFVYVAGVIGIWSPAIPVLEDILSVGPIGSGLMVVLIVLPVFATVLSLLGMVTWRYSPALLGLALGATEVSLVYAIKFHPWVVVLLRGE